MQNNNRIKNKSGLLSIINKLKKSWGKKVKNNEEEFGYEKCKEIVGATCIF